MKKLSGLHFVSAWLIILSLLVLFSGPAQAYVYDDFTIPGIDPNLWVDRGPNTGLFSQPGDGYLYFSDSSGGQADRIRSFNPVSGAFYVVMQFSDFQAINDQPPGLGRSSAVSLILGGSNYVSLQEFKNSSGLVIDAFSYIGGTRTPLNYVYPGDIHSGWLGIYYNGILGVGGEVDFWYDFGAGWTWLDSCAPSFSETPYFSIYGYDLFGSSLSFRVGYVALTPIPLPASALLMGSGLLGLAGLARFRKL